MRQVRDAVRTILKDDAMVQAYLGDRDNHNQPKVYEEVAQKDVGAPYIVWQIIPSSAPMGTYGDARSMEEINVQVAGWGRNRNEAWALFDHIQTALEIGEWDVYLTPYSLMRVIRMGTQQPLLDVETGFMYLPATYQVRISR